METKTLDERTNGMAMAAVLAASIGSFLLGLIVFLSATDWISIPALYQPSGGVSGRTTLAVILWGFSWGMLHQRWNGRHISNKRILMLSLILIAASLVLTFPPFWSLF